MHDGAGSCTPGMNGYRLALADTDCHIKSAGNLLR